MSTLQGLLTSLLLQLPAVEERGKASRCTTSDWSKAFNRLVAGSQSLLVSFLWKAFLTFPLQLGRKGLYC